MLLTVLKGDLVIAQNKVLNRSFKEMKGYISKKCALIGMDDTKQEQERDELHRAIWAIADELRGAVDGWDFKNYVLGTMFYRYISENLCNYINNGEVDAGNTDFDFAKRVVLQCSCQRCK